MIFLKLGFKNLLRNKRRSLLAGIAVGIGLASLILADGFWKGMIKNMVSTVTSTYIGHAQIHHSKFQDTQEAEFYLTDPESILEKLRSNPDVESASARTLSMGMVSSSYNSLNVFAMGINPKDEKKLSIFHERMLQGEFVSDSKHIVIGEALRKKLSVELGDRIVLTVSEVGTGEIKQELFRLTGVFGTGSKELDEGIILVDSHKLQTLLDIQGIHEIAIKFKDLEALERNKDFLKSFNSDVVIARPWQELVPQIVAAIEMSDTSIGIMAFVLFALVALGVLNTLFMSLYERKYEFGVIRALGTKSSELLAIIASEAFALAVVSVILGSIIASIIGLYWKKYGLDYSGISFGEITFTEKIYFIFSVDQFTLFPLGLIIFTVLISLYPAWHTIKMRPADALHRSL